MSPSLKSSDYAGIAEIEPEWDLSTSIMAYYWVILLVMLMVGDDGSWICEENSYWSVIYSFLSVLNIKNMESEVIEFPLLSKVLKGVN